MSVDMAKVLVVEDDDSNAHLAALFLERSGHSVMSCEGGQSALDSLDHHTFDLVVLDLRLPDMDGLELIRRLRAHPSMSAVPILAVTASRDAEQEAEASGVHHVLFKPYSGSEFRETVARLLSGRAEPT